jgi:hypothetical protein
MSSEVMCNPALFSLIDLFKEQKAKEEKEEKEETKSEPEKAEYVYFLFTFLCFRKSFSCLFWELGWTLTL